MMSGVSPEICWASYKYEINFVTRLDFLYELSYDARIHEYQDYVILLVHQISQILIIGH